MTRTIKTTCPYCGVGCGVLATAMNDGTLSIQGDPDHPANFGMLCSKGMNLHETVGLEGRLLHPKINDVQATWPIAFETVAKRFKSIIKEHGPQAIGFYVSGQLLSEDYYVANKLMKGFIGSSNIDTNSRLCMSSAVSAHKRAFGTDTVPACYEDIEKSDLVVLVGSNMAWCHPILFQRLKKAQEKRGTKIVVIDPRITDTCDIADLHLPIIPGTDVMLFNGLLSFLDRNGAKDASFFDEHTEGGLDALRTANETAGDFAEVAKSCGIELQELISFYSLFLTTPKTLSIFSQGVNQSSQGAAKVNAIINCHLLTGRIGKEGAGPFSITGQPNAMGGREVGGLANTLAAHMDFDKDSISLLERFWNSKNIASGPGKKAVDLFDAVHTGEIKAIWIMATNPAVSLPNSNHVREALDKCEFVVVSEAMEHTDTTQYADVLLPAATWGERSGTVTNSERRISRQRPIFDLPADALPDWQIITNVAQHMGYGEAFPYSTPHDVFKEHVALSAFKNNGNRVFDLSAWLNLSQTEYMDLAPTQWPVTASSPQGTKRFFGDGQFFTPSKKVQFIVTAPKTPVHLASEEYPLILNTGRVRDHWHTMNRTGKSPRLSGHTSEPFVHITETDAQQYGLIPEGLATVTSAWGHATLRVKISDTMRPGQIFSPIHWNDQNSSNAVVSKIINPVVDAISGQPESKHTPVHLHPVNAKWHGFLLSRTPIDTSEMDYWTLTQSPGCYTYDIAGITENLDWANCAKSILGEGEFLTLEDTRHQQWRTAKIRDNQLQGIMIVAQDKNSLPPRNWLEETFLNDVLNNTERTTLLAACPPQNASNAGPIVCSCFGVGMNTIIKAIKDQSCVSVEAIGNALQAGTNCGSCIPDLKALIKTEVPPLHKNSAA